MTHSVENDVAQRLMTAMLCKVESDEGECPSCDTGYCKPHGRFWYCVEHDWWEDDNAEGICGYALMLAGVALGTRVLPPVVGDPQ